MSFKKIITVKLPSKYGNFRLLAYQNSDQKYHLALVMGKPANKENVLVRIHSSCITGDIFSSSRCDCGQQLKKAMKLIAQKGEGIIIYLFQEGRGIGLINKLRAYKLQEQGLDTYDANTALGLPPDNRTYEMVKTILKDIKVKSIKLISNNPDKFNQLRSLNLKINGAIPLEIRPTKYNHQYLLTKKIKFGHTLKYL
ncbi:MAG: GTP cyclohydrolase II [Candidatus Portnoybacteria bacterium CG06_land_8_20_14_3_00_39_12]|uniref:GTP cyclohydrolase-2 n=2 Tax=Parcubacteria group TaxID=1794811 RepID=A0A2M7AW35_9BACT|nr:MAG: GTP cyclohydrolase II [Candidatus Portnoybacteria bacterium CG06_land_8_20_14_3_00_39_12]PIZ88625.1 MAG: GTP cyclohydrolase II [Candidatus Nealsonbacteria bacterium CG_4_10_14_0_2_um_filter_38_17]